MYVNINIVKVRGDCICLCSLFILIVCTARLQAFCHFVPQIYLKICSLCHAVSVLIIMKWIVQIAMDHLKTLRVSSGTIPTLPQCCREGHVVWEAALFQCTGYAGWPCVACWCVTKGMSCCSSCHGTPSSWCISGRLKLRENRPEFYSERVCKTPSSCVFWICLPEVEKCVSAYKGLPRFQLF